jgi:hypothetical protein
LDFFPQHAKSSLRQRSFSWEQVWLFTDDSDGVKSEFAKLIRAEQLNVIDVESELNSVEVMTLMSNANTSVIANSTFSWRAWHDPLQRVQVI